MEVGWRCDHLLFSPYFLIFSPVNWFITRQNHSPQEIWESIVNTNATQHEIKSKLCLRFSCTRSPLKGWILNMNLWNILRDQVLNRVDIFEFVEASNPQPFNCEERRCFKEGTFWDCCKSGLEPENTTSWKQISLFSHITGVQIWPGKPGFLSPMLQMSQQLLRNPQSESLLQYQCN